MGQLPPRHQEVHRRQLQRRCREERPLHQQGPQGHVREGRPDQGQGLLQALRQGQGGEEAQEAQGQEGQEPQEEGCRQEARRREEGQEPQEEGRRQAQEGQDPQEACCQEARRQEACCQETRSQEAGEEGLSQEEGRPQEKVRQLPEYGRQRRSPKNRLFSEPQNQTKRVIVSAIISVYLVLVSSDVTDQCQSKRQLIRL